MDLLYLLAFVAYEAEWFLSLGTARFSTPYAHLSLVPILGPLTCIWILACKLWSLKSKMIV
ncbi:hypothetical protein JJQ59_25405 [Cupriavidus necator]|uniref:Uncharacterized protein n=1 Tax=Cupriavidus necator TaxID=106590 RepID=A0A367PS07_CUPNE|nr:hypothetical protein [Cupriavidus necator]QQX89018.1 hypothetical protein JJQ59_25405 [Cupriavidus necator]RCJ09826.1 hypothetical protein DDK22_04205 [Cupriavidus necator]